jgi:hypothetical protein
MVATKIRFGPAGGGNAPGRAHRHAPVQPPVLLVLGGLVAGNGLLDILEGQNQLLGIDLLRTPAELLTLHRYCPALNVGA